MRPGNLMMLGVATAICGVVGAVFSEPSAAALLAFGGGALFGKGYGVMEERERKKG